MSNAREEFLRRVRAAVIEGNRACAATGLPDRGAVGYQGAGADPVSRFVQEWTAAGGHAHVVPNTAAAAATVTDLVRQCAASRVLLGCGPVVDSLGLEAVMRDAGIDVTVTDVATPGPDRALLFRADVGVSGVDYLIAETGTVVLGSRPEQPRCVSLLPPVHIAVAAREQILADLFDLFATAIPINADMASALSLITGPSKTGDIELRLVTGVHGPGVVHVVLIDPAGA
jgi:L-lactate dehydrogenase complex protein LldG